MRPRAAAALDLGARLARRARRAEALAVALLSRVNVVAAYLALAWGLVALPWGAWTCPDWTLTSALFLGVLAALSLACAPLVAGHAKRNARRANREPRAQAYLRSPWDEDPPPARLAGEHSGVMKKIIEVAAGVPRERPPDPTYSAGVASVKTLAMAWVAVIHAGCEVQGHPVLKWLVPDAAALLFVAMGVTGLPLSPRRGGRKSGGGGGLPGKFAALLRPWYVFCLFNWSYRYLDGSGQMGRYTTEEQLKILGSALLGFSPCMGGAWFAFPALQLLAAGHMLRKLRRSR